MDKQEAVEDGAATTAPPNAATAVDLAAVAVDLGTPATVTLAAEVTDFVHPETEDVEVSSSTAFNYAKKVVELAGHPTHTPNRFCSVTSVLLILVSRDA